jgi:hypothetical protein
MTFAPAMTFAAEGLSKIFRGDRGNDSMNGLGQ